MFEKLTGLPEVPVILKVDKQPNGCIFIRLRRALEGSDE
jgi:hypothetical protein